MLAAHADHVALVMQSGLCKSVSTSTPRPPTPAAGVETSRP